MLNGIAPIFIIQLKKNIYTWYTVVDKAMGKNLPIIPTITENAIPFPPIPIYLHPDITGIHIESEQKHVDFDTTIATLQTGEIETEQKGLGSTLSITMIADKNSVGLNILLAFADIIFGKATSKEYSVSYISGAMSIFGGLVDNFSVQQSNDNSLYTITLNLSTGKTPKAASTILVPNQGATPLG